MANGIGFFGDANLLATDYGHAQRQAEREAEQAKEQARAWQAHAQEMEAAYKAMKAQRDEFQARAESWKETVRELNANGLFSKEVANNIYFRKYEEFTSKKN